MTQYGFFFDMNRCYACQACSIACKDWNGLEPGAEKWMGVYEWEQGTFPNIRLHALAFPCGHCEDPACAKACPTDALRLIDADFMERARQSKRKAAARATASFASMKLNASLDEGE